jgi:membrane protease YdiL (CAAX protease family)
MTKNKLTETKIEQSLATWGIIVILWSLYRANFPQLPLWFNEILAKPVVFLIPIYFYLKNFLKVDNFLLGVGFPKKNILKEVLFSLFLVLFIIGIGILTFIYSDSVKLSYFSAVNFNKLAVIFVLAVATATVEEVLGRGFLFNYLYKFSKSFIASLLLSSSLFFILYLPGALSSNVSGPDLFLNLLFNFSLSFVAGTLFYLRKNLFAAIAIHTCILIWFDIFLYAF